MKKRERKGFTLIELLVTILIVSLITTVAIVSITKIISISKEKKNSLSISNIKASAKNYVEEFKREDRLWFTNSTSDENEYVCATVGRLIDKGFLKENILSTEIDGKTITRNTSIMLARNKTTKVLTNEDLLFNSKDCKENNEVTIDFIVTGNKGEDKWYIGDVLLELNIGNAEQIQETETKYQLTKNGSVSDKYTKSDNIITITEEGRNIDFCITIINLKDEEKAFCLSDNVDSLYIDKTIPEIAEENFKFDNNYNLIVNDATDNITPSNEIRYYLTYDTETESKGNVTYNIDDTTRVTDKEVKVYVKDEAGNKSTTITKKLNIADSENATVTSDTKYYCSLDNTIAYASNQLATEACNKSQVGNVTSKTVYYCSLNSNEYTTESEAIANCTATTTGTVTSDRIYYCSLDNNEYSSKSAATSACTVQGDYDIEYSCSSGTLSGSKCYSESSATKKTMYGLTCSASTTYGWSSGSTTSGLSSCTSSTASCSSSSHVGNKKVSCSSHTEYTGSFKDKNTCIELVDSGCTCTLTNSVWRGKCKTYTKTTYTCQSSTGKKTYTGKTGGTTTGGCPSGATATLDSSESTCSNYIGDLCSSSCSSCCGDYKYYTCTTSTSADKEYYCNEDGRTYSSASSCKKTGSVTSETEYYCSLNNNTYSSETSATNACKKTTNGTVTNKTSYFCSLDSNTYNDYSTANSNCNKTLTGTVSNSITYYCPLQNTSGTDEQTQINNCTNYCRSGTYYNNACYNLN